MIDPNDLDGFNNVLDNATQGNINNVNELVNAMEEKCSSLLDAIRMFYSKLIVMFDSLDDNAKNLIKNVCNTQSDLYF